MDKLIFTITDAGRQEIINASNTGTEKVEIKSVGVGDIYYLTSPDQTEIGGEIKRITGIGGAVISPDTIHVSAKDDSNDEYVVHTVGLYTDKGTLFAVYSRKEPIINKSASTIMLISSDITFKSLDTANITFGDVVFINPPASESVVGVSRFATAEEVEEGLDPAIAVSAKRLKGELDKKANLDSPNLTGTPTAPTAAESDNSQKIATTAFIKQVLLAYAKLASPNFTGKPTAPTADHSSNDTQIATTAFVRAAIAALVDSSPGALDTLNELAAAIGNDPNFATTMINALAGKQPLDGTLTNLSGKDVPALLQYLGLVETINRAAGSLQKDQNLNDISDKVQARNALQLGTAATLDATTSRNDNTLGRVLKVGDRNLGVTVIPASRGFNFNSYEFAAGETLFIEVNAAINFPAGMPEFANTFVYVNVIGIRDSGNDCALLLSRYDTNISYLAWRIHEANTSINWRVLKIPTAAADIRAIPKDPIGTIGNNGRMASADTPGWWLVSVADAGTVADFPKYPNGNKLYGYGFMFVARSGDVWLQQYFSHTGASASRQTWNGDMSEQTPWVIDYNTANKPTASDVGALPITGGGLNGNLGIGTNSALGGNSIALGDNDTGFKQNGDGILDVYANNVHV
ncbi:hypothetical protein QU896_27850 [Citrobacter freundii]|uniref:hypothetical protein n=1 Tax=Citrobacter freundii TaxID=546 RepID=UPI0038BE3EAE